MLDSTDALASPPDTRETRWSAEMRRRRALRRDVTWGLDTRALGAAMRLVNSDSPPQFSAQGIAGAHITCQTALILGAAWQEKRSLRPREAATFRILGDLAERAPLSEDEVLDALEAGTQEALAAARLAVRGAPYADKTKAAVLAQLESEAQAFSDEASKELGAGRSGELREGEGRAAVLLRLLDGRLSDDELKTAAGAVGLKANSEHGLVLLVHPTGCALFVEAAAREVEATIPGAVDIGFSDALPIARRVVFPVPTHGRWIEARTTLHDIATKHGVLAVAPIQAPTLGRLAEACHLTERDLTAVVKGCGYASGIIDPACVGPACPAEGTSPAPAEEWPMGALVPVGAA